jgi:hypothetical protein
VAARLVADPSWWPAARHAGPHHPSPAALRAAVRSHLPGGPHAADRTRSAGSPGVRVRSGSCARAPIGPPGPGSRRARCGRDRGNGGDGPRSSRWAGPAARSRVARPTARGGRDAPARGPPRPAGPAPAAPVRAAPPDPGRARPDPGTAVRSEAEGCRDRTVRSGPEDRRHAACAAHPGHRRARRAARRRCAAACSRSPASSATPCLVRRQRSRSPRCVMRRTVPPCGVGAVTAAGTAEGPGDRTRSGALRKGSAPRKATART